MKHRVLAQCIIASFVPLLTAFSCESATVGGKEAGGGDSTVAGQCETSEGQPVAVGGIGDWSPSSLMSHEGSDPLDGNDTGPFVVAGGRVDYCTPVGELSGRRRCCCTAVSTASGEVEAASGACQGGEPSSTDCSDPSRVDLQSITTDAQIDQCFATADFGPPPDPSEGLLVAGPPRVDFMACVDGVLYLTVAAVGVIGATAGGVVVVAEPTPIGEAIAAVGLTWAAPLVAAIGFQLAGSYEGCGRPMLELAMAAARAGQDTIASALRWYHQQAQRRAAMGTARPMPFDEIPGRANYPQAEYVRQDLNGAVSALNNSSGCRDNEKRSLWEDLHGVYYTITQRGAPPDVSARALIESVRALLQQQGCNINGGALQQAVCAYLTYLQGFPIGNPDGVLARAVNSLRSTGWCQ